MRYEITEGSRVRLGKTVGTVVALAIDGMVYLNPDTNKRGNDGIVLVEVSELVPLEDS